MHWTQLWQDLNLVPYDVNCFDISVGRGMRMELTCRLMNIDPKAKSSKITAQQSQVSSSQTSLSSQHWKLSWNHGLLKIERWPENQVQLNSNPLSAWHQTLTNAELRSNELLNARHTLKAQYATNWSLQIGMNWAHNIGSCCGYIIHWRLDNGLKRKFKWRAMIQWVENNL